MASFSRADVVLVRYPFSDLSASKVRPAVVVSAPHPSVDLIIVPLTSRTTGLLPGEFTLADWKTAGLNVPTAAKRGAYTIHPTLIAKRVGRLSAADEAKVGVSLRSWIGL